MNIFVVNKGAHFMYSSDLNIIYDACEYLDPQTSCWTLKWGQREGWGEYQLPILCSFNLPQECTHMKMRCYVPTALHNLLKSHYKVNEESLHGLVGDIVKTEMSKSGIQLPCPYLKYPVDCKILGKQGWHSTTNHMGSQPD